MPWPTLAAACWVARSRGRLPSDRGASPEAIAPDDTRTTSRPPARAADKASTSASIRCWSSPPAAEVIDDDPTLTTTRAAAAAEDAEDIRSATLEPQVGAAAAVQQLRTCLHRRLPVEDDARLAVADHDLVTGLRTRGEQG